MRTTLQDLRYALRVLARQRLFTVMALITLALGIGANSAIFAVVNAVLLRPLPYRDPGRLVLIEELIATLTREGMPVPPPDVIEFQQNSKTFEAVAGFDGKAVDLTGQGQPERLQGLRASAELFQVLGVAPMLGRGFTHEEDRPGSGVAVISYRLWQRRFGGDRRVVGRVITLDRQPTTVLGVMPKNFEFPLPGIYYGGGGTDVWVPMGFTASELANHVAYNFGIVARLKPGVSLDLALADARAVAHHIHEQFPPRIRAEAALDAQVSPVIKRVVQGSRSLLWLLVGAVGFVLLIACVNVANLLLGRAAGREREFAVRSALGAGRARLFRQLLTESVLLSAAGGAVALLLAMWLVSFLARMIPSSVPRAATIDLDWRVVAFTAAVSVLAGLLFGTLPAMMAARSGEATRLKDAARGATSGARHARLRGLLVVGEVALSLVLLVGAGLLVRSFLALRAVDPGFDAEHVLTARVSLPASAYRGASIGDFYQRLLDGLSALPGVRAAGAATKLPLTLAGQHLFVVRDPAFPPALSSHAVVLGDYFQAVGIPLRRGRFFDSRDREGAEHVLIVNETLARTYFPGQNPVGQQIKLGSRESPDPWFTVVGVVADAKDKGLGSDAMPQTYLPYSEENWNSMAVAVKASARPEALTSALRAAVARLDPDLPVTNLQTTRALVEGSLAPMSFQTALVGSFAGLALLLAAIGIYGVVSYAVAQRTQEIGIRMALGASRTSVLKLVIGQGMRFVLAGVVLGLGASLALTRVMTGFLYGIKPTDAVTFALAPVVLSIVALAANFAPARRAASIDPTIALRYE